MELPTQVSGSFTSQHLLANLKESMLLAPAEFDRVEIAALDGSMDGLSLANYLLGKGVLTAYQLNCVISGKFAELTIGNYVVVDRLGAGGMGAVFKARHRRMNRVVALKVLASSLVADETFVQRFQREVEMIARFTHPNIVMAYDADESEMGPFLVMEFVDGHDLASLVQKCGALDLATAVDCILQTARGLAYAHGQGIIHRDIKPANLLRDAAGVVKVTDLGLARLSGAGAEGPSAGSITQAGGIVGTVDFMSPEQAVDSTRIDHRSDIYSLGATLFFLLTARPPFEGQTIMATLLKHREAPIPSLVQARNDVPLALDSVFCRMLAKAPADRFQTMAEVVLALEAIEKSLGRPSAEAAPQQPAPGGASAHSETQSQIAPLAHSPTLEVNAAPQPGGVRVLLVEPSRTQAGIIRRYLQAHGVVTIETAASGKEALDLVRRESPDAIISALHLADMTGIELARQALTLAPGRPPGFLLISSEAHDDPGGSLSQCGNVVVLPKPFTPEKLFEALSVVAPVRGARAPFRGRVLIVDDSAAARVHVRGVLKGLGLTQFTEAPDGAQAAALLAQQTFDLVVTDYNMPFMDGRGLVGYLKQNPATKSVPIIMVTTEQDPAKLEAVRQLGVTAICDKSFPVDVVRKIIDGL